MIFIDTSFWAALTARHDELDDLAVDLFTRHGTERLVTSNHVRGETWMLLSTPWPKRGLVPRGNPARRGLHLRVPLFVSGTTAPGTT